MKKLMLILVLVSGSLMSFANPTKIEYLGNEKAIIKKLTSKINLPDNLRKKSNTGVFKVEFILNDKGEIEIQNISGKNVEITSFIKTQFESLEVEMGTLEKDTTYYIDINLNII
ncbi:MAG: hypothetical protein AB7O47_03300 [Flavobacteriales bacterium]